MRSLNKNLATLKKAPPLVFFANKIFENRVKRVETPNVNGTRKLWKVENENTYFSILVRMKKKKIQKYF